MASKRIICADCESDPFRRGRPIAPFCFGAYECIEGSEKFTFFWGPDCRLQFVRWIEKQNVICYFHNGGGFDFHFIKEYIDDYEKLLIINGKLTSFKIGNCEFRDSLKIMPVPLSAINKDKFRYGMCDYRLREQYKEEIIVYLRNDCKYLFEAVELYRAEFGTKISIGANALAYWRSISGEKNPKTNKVYYDEIAPFYYGGRVECFEKGIIEEDKIRVVDINSAYPRAMLDAHPWGAEFFDVETYEEYRAAEYKNQSFITCRGIARGSLPYRCPKIKKLLFPNDGEIRTYKITGWELEKALELNAFDMVSFEYALIPYRVLDFKDYVNHFGAMKSAASASGDKTRRLFAKLYLNNLYGKFGMNGGKFREYFKYPTDLICEMEAENNAALDQGHEIVHDFDILYTDSEAGTGVISYPPESERFLDLAVSASITGYVRAFLFEAITRVDRPFYCDTDSIIFAGECDLELHPDRLGAWDIEGEGDYLAIGGKKMYCLKDKGKAIKTACKGARLKPDEICAVAEGKTVQWSSIAPSFKFTTPFQVGKKPLYLKRKVKRT